MAKPERLPDTTEGQAAAIGGGITIGSTGLVMAATTSGAWFVAGLVLTTIGVVLTALGLADIYHMKTKPAAPPRLVLGPNDRPLPITRRSPAFKIIVFGLGTVSLGALVGVVVVVFLRPTQEPSPKPSTAKQAPGREAPKEASETKAPPLVQPTPLARYYLLNSLPIGVAPHSTVYIVQLHPDITEGVGELKNDKQHAITWPPDLPREKGAPPPDFIVGCELTNYAEKALLDVRMSFNSRFYTLKPVAVTKRRRNPDGTFSFDIPLPPKPDTAVFTRQQGDRVESFTHGDLFKTFQRKVTIPAVSPRGSAKFYLVNQSRLIAAVDFPSTASVIVDGQPVDVTVNLRRPRVTVLDGIPYSILGPTTHRWRGVPDVP